jgi:hypothetical protein
MEPQELKSLNILCDMLIENLTIDKCDLDQIQKRLLKMGFNNKSQFNQVFQVMYNKFNEMEATKEMPKPTININNNDFKSEDKPEKIPKPELKPEPVETEEQKIQKTLLFYKDLKKKKLDWNTKQYEDNKIILKNLEDNDLKIQLKVKINNKYYPVVYSYEKYASGKKMAIIVGETTKFYKLQQIERVYTHCDENQTSYYKFVMPTEITGNHYKLLKDNYIYKFFIYEDLTESKMCD